MSSLSREQKNVKISLSMSDDVNVTEQMLYLCFYEGNECEIQDSIKISPKRSSYSLHGYVPYEAEITLVFSKRGPAKLNILVCPKDYVKLTITKEDDVIGIHRKKLIKGNKHNDLNVEFWNNIFRFTKMIRLTEDSLALNGITEQEINRLKQKHDSIVTEAANYKKNIVQTSPSPKVASTAHLLLWKSAPKAERDTLLRYIYKKFPEYPPIQRDYYREKAPEQSEQGRRNREFITNVARSRISVMNRKLIDTLKIGQKYDATLVDSLGKKERLSAFHGKYVLIELWASWCLPCIQAMPNIVLAQQRFKDDYVCCALSVDRSETSWKRSIRTNKLIELHHYKATSPDGEVYDDLMPLIAKGSIPQNYLLDREGRIIAINIYGEELIKKLEELTKK